MPMDGDFKWIYLLFLKPLSMLQLQECLARSSKVGGKNLKQLSKMLTICYNNNAVIIFSLNTRYKKGAHYWVIRSHGSSCIMSYSCKWNHFLSQKYHITCKRKVEAPRQGAAKGKLKTSVVAYVVVSFMCDCIFNRKEKYKNYLILNKHKIAKFS